MSDIVNKIIKSLDAEKSRINSQIEDLKRQVSIIDKMILTKKAELSSSRAGEQLNKKNIDRIINETRILECLRETKRGLRTMEILEALKIKGHILNENSLRSYIARMRDKGLIYKKRGSYYWLASDGE